MLSRFAKSLARQPIYRARTRSSNFQKPLQGVKSQSTFHSTSKIQSDLPKQSDADAKPENDDKPDPWDEPITWRQVFWLGFIYFVANEIDYHYRNRRQRVEYEKHQTQQQKNTDILREELRKLELEFAEPEKIRRT